MFVPIVVAVTGFVVAVIVVVAVAVIVVVVAVIVVVVAFEQWRHQRLISVLALVLSSWGEHSFLHLPGMICLEFEFECKQASRCHLPIPNCVYPIPPHLGRNVRLTLTRVTSKFWDTVHSKGTTQWRHT